MSGNATAKTARKPRWLDRYLALDDFEEAARRRLPRPLFGNVRNGTETDASVEGNRAAFRRYGFVTRTLTDITRRSLATPLLGKTYAAPFGIAPMGVSALNAYRGDVVYAQAARAAGVPMIMSGASLIPLEAVSEANPDAWFQAYLSGTMEKDAVLIDRVQKAGFKTLVVTVDIPVRANREATARDGFRSPLRPTPWLIWQGLSHPVWLVDVFLRTLLTHGMPHFENGSDGRRRPVISTAAAREFGGRPPFDWRHMDAIRKHWPGQLVIKGILSAEDARLAREHGADGVVLSNHGGRQLDGAMAPLLLLPEVIAAAGDMPVMIDGGFRRGSDVIKALALGAAFVFVGRPFNYAAAVGGEAGVAHAISLLRQEVDRNLAMLGLKAIDEIDESCLRLADDASPVAKRKPAREARVRTLA